MASFLRQRQGLERERWGRGLRMELPSKHTRLFGYLDAKACIFSPASASWRVSTAVSTWI